jgi:hypothetical protein
MTEIAIPSIYKYAELVGENHIVRHANVEKFLNDEDYDTSDLEGKLKGEHLGENSPILVITDAKKKSYYTPAQKRAIMKYREKHRNEYNESQRKLYEKNKQNEEWVKKHNDASVKYNEKYREVRKARRIEKDKADALAKGVEYSPKKRGRPRKSIL